MKGKQKKEGKQWCFGLLGVGTSARYVHDFWVQQSLSKHQTIAIAVSNHIVDGRNPAKHLECIKPCQ